MQSFLTEDKLSDIPAINERKGRYEGKLTCPVVVAQVDFCVDDVFFRIDLLYLGQLNGNVHLVIVRVDDLESEYNHLRPKATTSSFCPRPALT